jgi:hypothetical protein
MHPAGQLPRLRSSPHGAASTGLCERAAVSRPAAALGAALLGQHTREYFLRRLPSGPCPHSPLSRLPIGHSDAHLELLVQQFSSPAKPVGNHMHLRLLESFSRIWGGARHVIVPYTTEGIPPQSRRPIQRFDPDHWCNYEATPEAIRQADPEQFDRLRAAMIERIVAKWRVTRVSRDSRGLRSSTTTPKRSSATMERWMAVPSARLVEPPWRGRERLKRQAAHARREGLFCTMAAPRACTRGVGRHGDLAAPKDYLPTILADEVSPCARSGARRGRR